MESQIYYYWLSILRAARAEAAGLPPISLSRYDLHHAHLFLADPGEEEGCGGGGGGGSKRFGLLFHAKEYPLADADAFPADLGRCQRGSLQRAPGERVAEIMAHAKRVGCAAELRPDQTRSVFSRHSITPIPRSPLPRVA